MAVRQRLSYEQRGNPLLLAGAPDPSLLAEAKQTRKLLEKALRLREGVRDAQRQVREAEQAVERARKQDRAANAEAISRRPDAKVTNTRTEAAEMALEQAKVRLEAVTQATEDAADVLVAEGAQEADKLRRVAEKVTAKTVERVRRATEEIEAALQEQEEAIGISRWAADPSVKRWRVPLKTLEPGRPGIRVDRLLAALQALPDLLARQVEPQEPEPGVAWGWSGLGRVAPPPGAQGR
jgi:hypothetical protein